MDGYESLYESDKRRAAERKAARELEDARYEQEQQEAAARRAQQEAEQARENARRLRRENDEEREEFAAELESRRDEITVLTAEKATIVGALRKLVAICKPNGKVSSLEEYQREFNAAWREASELLRLIDAAPKKK